jgi:hypothetical protein
MAISKPLGDLRLDHIPIRLYLAAQIMPSIMGGRPLAMDSDDYNSDALAALDAADALLAEYQALEQPEKEMEALPRKTIIEKWWNGSPLTRAETEYILNHRTWFDEVKGTQ